MSDQVAEFILDALRQMNFDVDGADTETVFGPAGIDLDSMAVAELALRTEDRYKVRFSEEDLEGLAVMTVGEFAGEITARAAALAQPDGAPQ